MFNVNISPANRDARTRAALVTTTYPLTRSNSIYLSAQVLTSPSLINVHQTAANTTACVFLSTPLIRNDEATMDMARSDQQPHMQGERERVYSLALDK